MKFAHKQNILLQNCPSQFLKQCFLIQQRLTEVLTLQAICMPPHLFLPLHAHVHAHAHI